ncbi:MAG: hypothetical protein GY940_25375, partial [bacterium]|nr:hypothetical protein [bacterium]
EISPTVILGDLFTYCDQLLKENRLDKLTVLAKKLVRYAEDDARRNKLATLMMAKEIQGDIDGGNYFKLLELTELSIAETNIYKADYILDKLDKSSMDGTTREKVALLKEKLDSKKTEMQIGKVIREKADKIKKLGKQAKSFEAIKNYDEAINRYLEMYKLEPDNSEYSSKIKKLQLDKFNYEKFQKQIKARVEMDDLMLHAEDSVANDLMQDALDYYVKAYKKLPEEGKPIAGVIKVLEECGADDAKYITIALLGRKSSKFTKDFLRLVEKNYLNTNDETGFKILSRIIFIKNNKTFDELMLKIKANLHEKNMEIGHQRFKEALFETAASSFAVALGFKETELVQRWIEVCGELKKVKLLLNSNKKKDLGQYFDPDSLLNDPNKYEILEGVLNLSEFYLEKFDFKKGSYLYKRVGKFQFTKFNKSIEELKKKEKELKKKAKAARKKKGV